MPGTLDNLDVEKFMRYVIHSRAGQDVLPPAKAIVHFKTLRDAYPEKAFYAEAKGIEKYNNKLCHVISLVFSDEIAKFNASRAESDKLAITLDEKASDVNTFLQRFHAMLEADPKIEESMKYHQLSSMSNGFKKLEQYDAQHRKKLDKGITNLKAFDKGREAFIRDFNNPSQQWLARLEKQLKESAKNNGNVDPALANAIEQMLPNLRVAAKTGSVNTGQWTDFVNNFSHQKLPLVEPFIGLSKIEWTRDVRDIPQNAILLLRSKKDGSFGVHGLSSKQLFDKIKATCSGKPSGTDTKNEFTIELDKKTDITADPRIAEKIKSKISVIVKLNTGYPQSIDMKIDETDYPLREVREAIRQAVMAKTFKPEEAQVYYSNMTGLNADRDISGAMTDGARPLTRTQPDPKPSPKPSPKPKPTPGEPTPGPTPRPPKP